MRHVPCAVVVGLDCITGLQTARLLVRRGIPVVGVAGDRHHFCCRTNVCEQIVYADTGSDALIDALLALGEELAEPAVLFPCTDLSVSVISRNRQRLESGFRVTLPAPDVVELLMDKTKFINYAQDHGIPVPRTAFLNSRADAERAADELPFPLIMKPALKSPEWEQRGLSKVYRVSDPGELMKLYDELAEWTHQLVAQEWIEGEDSDLYSCNCYLDSSSKPLVTFVARKLRQWPPRAGTSCLGEECRNDVVLDETVRLFENLRYRGLGYVEMKRDARTGRHVIIEPNVGRPTGRSAIAEAGGVELLYTKYCDALGLPLPGNRRQRYSGAKWIYLRQDVQSAIYYLFRRELTLHGWWRSVRGIKADAVFSLTDPIPFWSDLWNTARRVAQRRRLMKRA